MSKDTATPPFASERGRMFRPGYRIDILADAIDRIVRGEYLMIQYGHDKGPKPQHPGFVMSLTVRTLLGSVEAGRVYVAKKTSHD